MPKIDTLHAPNFVVDMDTDTVARVNTDRYPDAVLDPTSALPGDELAEKMLLLEGTGKVTINGVTRWLHAKPEVIQAPATVVLNRSRHNGQWVIRGVYAPEVDA
jgi:hypothetical protein